MTSLHFRIHLGRPGPVLAKRGPSYAGTDGSFIGRIPVRDYLARPGGCTGAEGVVAPSASPNESRVESNGLKGNHPVKMIKK